MIQSHDRNLNMYHMLQTGYQGDV